MPSVKNLVTSHVLSTVLSKYGEQGFVADKIFVPVMANFRSGTIFKGGTEKLRPRDGVVRTGAMTTRVDFDYSDVSYKTVPYGYHTPLDQDMLDNAEAPINLRTDATEILASVLKLRHEIACQAICQSASVVTQTAAAAVKWDGAGAVDPKKDVDTGKEAIRKSKGSYPNTMLLAPTSRNALVNWMLARAQVSYGESAQVIELPPTVWGMTPVVPLVVKDSTKMGQTASLTDVYNDSVLLCLTAGASLMYQGAFLTIRRSKYPAAGYRVRTWFDEMTETEFVEAKVEEDELTVDATAAYLITDTIT